jgi:hypothetical protein
MPSGRFSRPTDTVTGAKPLNIDEYIAYSVLMSSTWGPAEERAAENRELLAAENHLAYLHWLRDVTLP